MNDWTHGYVADIGYTYGYYTDLNPLRASLPITRAGFHVPTIQTACELGFGQGVSVNLHAAGSNIDWHGTDFNPAQARFAQDLAQASGASCQLYDQSFEQFCQRQDLPDFDLISLHGIWSWISDKNRQVIADFIARKLKVGGLVYVSYNTLPGWSQMLPVREVLTQHADRMSAPSSPLVSRIDASIGFMERLFALQPAMAKIAPIMMERFKRAKEMDRHYLAHEYFNRDWEPMSFAAMNGFLSETKLSYVCSAHYIDHVDATNLSDEQAALLNELHDPCFKESVRDLLTSQAFRRDYWVKGPTRLGTAEQVEALRYLRFVLVNNKADVQLTVKGLRGEATLQPAVYDVIFSAINDNHEPFSIAEVESAVRGRLTLGQVVQACLCLAGKGDMFPVLPGTQITERVRQQARRLNEHIIQKAWSIPELTSLCSPVIAGGIQVSRFHQMFIGSILKGFQTDEAISKDVLASMNAQGQRVLKNGKSLDGQAESLAEIQEQVQAFKTKRQRVLESLQII